MNHEKLEERKVENACEEKVANLEFIYFLNNIFYVRHQIIMQLDI